MSFSKGRRNRDALESQKKTGDVRKRARECSVMSTDQFLLEFPFWTCQELTKTRTREIKNKKQTKHCLRG